MVLESLTNPYKAEQHPAWLILHGAVYAIAGLLLGLYFFPDYASMVMLTFIAAASIPLLYNIIKYEEDKDYHEMQERALIKEHSRAILAYFMLFVGVTLALTAAYVVMPEETISDAFGAQITEYQQINPTAKVTGQATGGDFFSRIFFNNFRVLIFCILFSLLYGAGAVFVLSWNASVIALAMGNTIRTKAAAAAGAGGLTQLGTYLEASGHTVFLRYGIHGSLEIIAYMVAALAGGIISVAIIKHHYRSKKFEHIIMDSVDLIIISIGLLVVAAGVETWITPIFY